MFRIGEKVFDGFVYYHSGPDNSDIEVEITDNICDEDIDEIKNGTELEILVVRYGEITGVRCTYSLLGWRKVEKTDNGVKVSWQTYRTTDMEQLKQDNEDLTNAILELAAIIGGDENG